MKNLIKNRQGISAIFAIIVVTALLIITVSLNETILRNVERVGEMEAMLQAQSAANSAFEMALVEVSNSAVGQDSGEITGSIYLSGADVVASYVYEINGVADIGESGYYYVPSPGYGDAGEDCDSSNPPASADDDCNWNKIYYGENIEIPLYTGSSDTFDGDEFYIRVRTPDGEVIVCEDGTESDSDLYACLFEDNPVIVTWQITGARDSGSDYLEGYEADPKTDAFRNEYRDTSEDSQISTLLINYAKNNDDYITVSSDSIYAPAISMETIIEALTDGADPLTTPTLKLSFVQSIADADGDAIPYLEYQVVTNSAISNETTQISVTGYTENKGETFFWTKTGSWTQFSSSPINFVFQN